MIELNFFILRKANVPIFYMKFGKYSLCKVLVTWDSTTGVRETGPEWTKTLFPPNSMVQYGKHFFVFPLPKAVNVTISNHTVPVVSPFAWATNQS